jgi:hypothetical protein
VVKPGLGADIAREHDAMQATEREREAAPIYLSLPDGDDQGEN